MGVDYETRVDFDRLREHRLARATAVAGGQRLRRVPALRLLQHPLHDADLDRRRARGQDDPVRAADPGRRSHVLWDFGSAARHHKLYSPWLAQDDCRAGMLGLRGAIAPTAGLMADAVREIKGMLADAGLAGEPVGVDIVEPPFLFEMQRQGLTVVDAQQFMLDARQLKSPDEIMLLTQAAAMVDGVYQDIVEVLKPGIRENEIVALANKRLYEMGSDQVEAINAVSGERCNPHPHNFSDRLIRPGDQAFFDIIHSYNGYRTCYYRTFCGRQRDAEPAGRVHEGAGVDGRRDRRGEAGGRHRRGRRGVAAGDRVRLRERDGRVRPAVRPRARARPARAADHLPAEQHAGAHRAAGRDGLRVGDVLPGRATGSPPPGSRRRSSSQPTARGSSHCSPPRTWSSRTRSRRSHGRQPPPTSSSAASGCRPRPAAGSTCTTRPPARSSPSVADGTRRGRDRRGRRGGRGGRGLGRHRAAGSGRRSCAARSS